MQEATSSTIVYTLTMEDLVALNLFRFRRLPMWRNLQRRSPFYNALAVILGVLLLWSMEFDTSLAPFFGFSLIFNLYLFYYRKRGYIKHVRKAVQRAYSEKDSAGLLGQHTLEVDEDGITHTSEYSRTRYTWGALKQIESEPPYTFIKLGELTFILRDDAIISGDPREFLEKIGRHHQAGRALAR